MSQKKLKKWVVAQDAEALRNDECTRKISESLGLLLPTAQLLVNRGYHTPELAEAFLSKKTQLFHDPFLMRDMEKAAARIKNALDQNEKITIYGDYDVDGVTSVSILYLYLKEAGANVDYYIPCRNGEGYGISVPALQKISDSGTNLIITVDTGITAVEEAACAVELGMEMIVTDHHECRSDLPKVCAVVNPKRPDCSYPFKDLAGVGVVFKLLCAVECVRNGDAENSDQLRQSITKVSRDYCDLVAIGTVADVMPLKDENRLIVSYGLKMIESNRRPGLDALIDASQRYNSSSSETKSTSKLSRKKVTSGFIGYTIAPRINAAGRIANASLAVDLFLTEDSEKASDLAMKLCEINRERQIAENRIAEEAYEKIAASHDFDAEPVIVLDDENWHHGIIGIVASRITEKFGCPTILISFEGGDDGEDAVGKGSGRSIKGMNLVDALTECGDLLEKYGGHELAAGLTLRRSQLDEFRCRINRYAKKCFESEELASVAYADCELLPEDIDMQLAGELYHLEPYGVSNPMPVFATYDAEILDITSISAGKHTKLTLNCGGLSIVAMGFGMPADEMDLYPGDRVDVMYNLDINEFQNIKSLQMVVRQIRIADRAAKKLEADMALYESIRNGSFADTPEDTIPTRDDLAVVYSFLKRELRLDHEIFSIRALLHHVGAANIGYVKLKLILLIFQELNILGVEEISPDVFRFKMVYLKNKTSLEKSGIYKKLKNRHAVK